MPDEQVIATPAEVQESQAAPVDETSTTASESATGEQPEPQGEDKPKGGFQRRIDKLTREKADKEREAEFWRQEALKTRTVETKQEAKPVDNEPNPEDFTSNSEYVRAVAKHAAKQAADAIRAEYAEEKKTTQQTQTQKVFEERQESFRAATPDFDEVLAGADIRVSDALRDEIVFGEDGPAIQYHLAKNPEDADRLNKLSPQQLQRELGRMESRFKKAQSAPGKTVTNAPPPPSPMGSSGKTAELNPYKRDLTFAEHLEWVKKHPNG